MSPRRELQPGWRIGISPFRQSGRNAYGVDVHGIQDCTSIVEDGEVVCNVSFV